MINNLRISLVLPCYNEEDGLKQLLPFIPDCVDEVIVVDNNSLDNTRAVARRYQAKVVKEDERGYGNALLAGLRYAKGDVLVVMDADGSYPISYIERFVVCLETNRLDFISGCRFPLSERQAMKFLNRTGNLLISALVRILFRIDLIDSQSGYMVFKRELFEKLQLENKGMGFSQEFKIKARFLSGAACAELPISYSPRIGTEKFHRIRDAIGNLYGLLCLFITLRK